MKAITLIQPWASAMRSGLKSIETRSWSTKHRGPLAIHAGLKLDRARLDAMMIDEVKRVKAHLDGDAVTPKGFVLGVVDLVDVVPMVADDTGKCFAGFEDVTDRERAWGDWNDGRFAWNTRPLVWLGRPIPCGWRCVECFATAVGDTIATIEHDRVTCLTERAIHFLRTGVIR